MFIIDAVCKAILTLYWFRYGSHVSVASQVLRLIKNSSGISPSIHSVRKSEDFIEVFYNIPVEISFKELQSLKENIQVGVNCVSTLGLKNGKLRLTIFKNWEYKISEMDY